LDVGVTADKTADSNFFEKLYPNPEKIIAVGLEDATFLEDDYPGLQFVKADACQLPFNDNSFDLAFCSAVIEHVGSRQRQAKLIHELVRVSQIAVITTPNRYFPVEFHTLTPFIHWLHPQIFRAFLRLTGRNFFSRECNLNLLTNREITDILKGSGIAFSTHHHKLGGMTSNLIFYMSQSQSFRV